MSAALKIENRRYGVDEYLDLIGKLDGKYEYRNGKLIDWRMMAGTSEPHVLIAANVIAAAHGQLAGTPCRVYGSDLLVRIANKSRYRYPDLSIVCGPTEFDVVDKGRRIAVSNPTVLIEILSETSERNDRGEKFEEYRQIPSVREYVLVAQHKPLIETFRRNDDGTWGILAVSQELQDTLVLRSAGVTISLAEVYAGVTFPPAEVDDDEQPPAATDAGGAPR